MLVNLNDVLVPARKHGYAVGAFNIFNMETVDAVYRAAVELKWPVIFAFGERYIETANLGIVAAMVQEYAQRTVLPMVLHLDHCKSVGVIYQAVQAGFTSVMFDGSGLPLEENIARTKSVTAFAKSTGVSVEAELGSVPFDHAKSEVPEAYYTKVDEAAQFVKATGVDALAVAIGTVHGEYKGKPKLDHERLKAIAKNVSVPLVLHGGSGIPDDDVLKSIGQGIAKINVNTQISSVAVKKLKTLCSQEKPGHLSDLLHEAENVMIEEVKGFIRLFSNGNSPVW